MELFDKSKFGTRLVIVQITSKPPLLSFTPLAICVLANGLFLCALHKQSRLSAKVSVVICVQYPTYCIIKRHRPQLFELLRDANS